MVSLFLIRVFCNLLRHQSSLFVLHRVTLAIELSRGLVFVQDICVSVWELRSFFSCLFLHDKEDSPILRDKRLDFLIRSY